MIQVEFKDLANNAQYIIDFDMATPLHPNHVYEQINAWVARNAPHMRYDSLKLHIDGETRPVTPWWRYIEVTPTIGEHARFECVLSPNLMEYGIDHESILRRLESIILPPNRDDAPQIDEANVVRLLLAKELSKQLYQHSGGDLLPRHALLCLASIANKCDLNHRDFAIALGELQSELQSDYTTFHRNDYNREFIERIIGNYTQTYVVTATAPEIATTALTEGTVPEHEDGTRAHPAPEEGLFVSREIARRDDERGRGRS